jgi:hypothetical protein
VPQRITVTDGRVIQLADGTAGQVQIAAPSVITGDDTGCAVGEEAVPDGHIDKACIEVAALPFGSTATDQSVGNLHIHIDRRLGIGGGCTVDIKVTAVVGGGSGIVAGAVFDDTTGDAEAAGAADKDTFYRAVKEVLLKE